MTNNHSQGRGQRWGQRCYCRIRWALFWGLAALLLRLPAPSADLLLRAVETRDASIVREILERAPALARNANSTALHKACGSGSIELVRLLLAKGADVDLLDATGRTALFYAQDHLQCAEAVLKARDSKRPVPDGNSVLVIAAEVGNAAMAKLLFRYKALAGASPSEESEAFAAALIGRNSEILELLRRERYKEPPPLVAAILLGSNEKVLAEIAHDPTTAGYSDEEGRSYVYWAARAGNVEALRTLVARQARVETLTRFGSTPLQAAISSGNLEAVALLLKHGANPNHRDIRSFSPLLMACDRKSAPICELLLRHKADPNQICRGETPLIFASRLDTVAICELLLKHGADAKQKVSGGRTAMHVAAWRGHAEILTALLNSGSKANEADDEGQTALHEAVRARAIDCVRVLLKAGAHVDCLSPAGTPLEIAVVTNEPVALDLLLQAGANPNLFVPGRPTPLQLAAWNGNLEMMQKLVKAGAAISATNGETVMRTAAMPVAYEDYHRVLQVFDPKFLDGFETNNNAETIVLDLLKVKTAALNGRDKISIIDWLLKQGALLEAPNASGLLPLHSAAEGGSLELTQFLLDRGSNPNVAANNSVTPVMTAASAGSFEVVKLLVEKGADVNTILDSGISPLAAGCLRGHFEMAKFLVEHGAESDLQGTNGSSVLHWAARENKVDFLKLFLTRKPNLDRQHDGMTPLNLAAISGHLEVVKLLVEEGANPRIRDQAGFTPFLSAAEKGHFPILEYLADRVDLGDTNELGENALHVATSSRNQKVVAFLLRRNLDPNAKNSPGNTPLHLAAGTGDAKSCRVLLKADGDPAVRAPYGLPLHSAFRSLTQMNAANQGHIQPLSASPGYSTNPELQDPKGLREVIDLIAPLTPIDARGPERITPLHIVAAYGKPSTVRRLLERGANPNVFDASGLMPLFTAAFRAASVETFQLLLTHRADLKPRDLQGNTVLHFAAQNCGPEVINLLIKAGADVNARGLRGSTPLHWAAAKNSPETVEALLRAGANPGVEDDNGLLPIYVSLFDRRFENCKRLLPHYRDVNRKIPHIGSLLILAAGQGAEEIVKKLLERKANINIKGERNLTALYAAIHNHHPAVVKLLLGAGPKLMHPGSEPMGKFAYDEEIIKLLQESGVSLSEADSDGYATFQTAVDHGYDRAVRFLLMTSTDAGALANSKVKDGRSCVHLAAQGAFASTQPSGSGPAGEFQLLRPGPPGPVDYAAVLRWLIAAGADLSHMDTHGNSALHHAVHFRNLPAVETLLEFGAPVNARNAAGETPLHEAVNAGNYDAALALLQARANPLLETSLGRSALSIAKGGKNPEMAEILESYAAMFQ